MDQYTLRSLHPEQMDEEDNAGAERLYVDKAYIEAGPSHEYQTYRTILSDKVTDRTEIE
jgi:hypothetical protein